MPDPTDPMAGISAGSRPPPPLVQPVVRNGVRFEQATKGLPLDAEDTSGWLRAVDESSGAELWLKQVYTAPPREAGDPRAALGPRTVFMRDIHVDGSLLLIEDELGRRFHVDPDNGAAIRLP